MRKKLKLPIALLGIAALVGSGLYAFNFYKQYKIKDAYARRFIHMPRSITDEEWGVFKTTNPAMSIPCADFKGKRTMVALVLGQSNAANSVYSLYTPRHAVYAYYNHACYKASDPLPGASGDRGSTWGRLGDRLIEAGLYDKVLFVSIARRGSSILNWAHYGDLTHLMRKTARELRADGLQLTHVLFHQGEADCPVGMSGEDYHVLLQSFLTELREAVGEKPAIFVCRTTRMRRLDCPDNADPRCFETCPGITRAQTEAADPGQGIYSGPDTDAVVPYDQRPDGYHFSGQGSDAFAAAWVPILARYLHGQ